MEEPSALLRHRILVGPKVGQAGHRKGEGLRNVLSAGGLHGEVNGTRMMAVVGADKGFHLGVDLIAGKHGCIRGGRVAFPREPVLSVKAVLPSHRFSTLHHPTCGLADFSIEGIHAKRRLGANALNEPRTRREPAGMFVKHQTAGLLEGSDLQTEFPLGCPNTVDGPEAAAQFVKNVGVGQPADDVHDRVASRLQFKCKMPLIGQQHAQFLLVVGATLRFV